MTDILEFFDGLHPIMRFTILAVSMAGWPLIMAMIVMQRRTPVAVVEDPPAVSEISDSTELITADLTVPLLPADQEKLRLELHQVKQQSERDHWQLSRALPAFERVTKQNDELRRCLAESAERMRAAEEHIAKLEQVLKVRSKRMAEAVK